MNDFYLNFVNAQAQRDQALAVVAGLCLAFVLSWRALGWYGEREIVPPVVVTGGRWLLAVAWFILYAWAWAYGITSSL